MLEEIRSLWVGQELGVFGKLSIQSFLDHGHPFRLFTYGNVSDAPEGAILEDGRSILPFDALRPFQARGAALAHFADWFRWELLRMRGGYWVDLDMVCLRPFEFQAPIVFGYEDPFTPSIGVLRFPAGHPMTCTMVDRCANPHRIRPHDSPRRRIRKLLRRLGNRSVAQLDWGEAGGPSGFREALKGQEWAKYGLPYTFFYPVHHRHWPCLFDDTFRSDLSFFNDTHGVHLWNGLYPAQEFNSGQRVIHPKSAFAQLRDRHLTKA